MKVEVLGAGCKKCHALADLAQDVIKTAGIAADVELVTDMKRIMGYGVLSTPALVVDGKVKCAGRMPSAGEVNGWLQG
ncbi:MAG: thioredoxin family protein [Armatimonadota bacterium]|jgi:small redox-active disulfide protein 2